MKSKQTSSAKLFKAYRGKAIQGVLHQGEALRFLRSRPDCSADVIFLDPPFNLGKIYSRSRKGLDRRPNEIYEKWLTDLLQESSRVLAAGGTLFLYHLPLWAIKSAAYLSSTRLIFRHWIAISMKNGFVRGTRLYPAHYALLMYSKGKPRHFKRPRIPLAECRHCGEYVKDYGGYLPIVERRGVNLSDIWDDLSPVRHATRKNRRANELPQAMMQRIIEIAGFKGGTFLDPFAGTGTGIITAVKGKMRFFACDLLASNCKLIVQRLNSLD
jgi:site-specific DNA-methyltransferase (adenine-specific)